MNIPGIPESIKHEDWLAALKLVGFDVQTANISRVSTELSSILDFTAGARVAAREVLVVTTKTGHTVTVPFEFERVTR